LFQSFPYLAFKSTLKLAKTAARSAADFLFGQVSIL
jgi:hypothetical protein